jgi:hypothetical protein
MWDCTASVRPIAPERFQQIRQLRLVGLLLCPESTPGTFFFAAARMSAGGALNVDRVRAGVKPADVGEPSLMRGFYRKTVFRPGLPLSSHGRRSVV